MVSLVVFPQAVESNALDPLGQLRKLATWMRSMRWFPRTVGQAYERVGLSVSHVKHVLTRSDENVEKDTVILSAVEQKAPRSVP